MDLPQARHQHPLESLLVWKHVIPGAGTAVLPPSTQRPNPLVVEDLVIASVCSPGAIHAVRRASGEPVWNQALDAYAGSCVTPAHRRIYGMSSRSLYCLDAVTGAPAWVFTPYASGSETIYSYPALSHDRVFIGDRRGFFHCLDALSGVPIWARRISDAPNNQVNSTAAICRDTVIVGTNDSCLAAFDIGTGEEVWRQTVDGPCSNEVLLHDDRIVARTITSIHSIDPGSGEVLDVRHWPDMYVHALATAGTGMLVVARRPPDRNKPTGRDVPHGSLLIGLGRGRETFRRPAAEFVVAMRFDPVSGAAYESRLDGLGILDPSTGERQHNVHAPEHLLDVGIVDVQGGRIYAMDSDRDIYCLRNPLA